MASKLLLGLLERPFAPWSLVLLAAACSGSPPPSSGLGGWDAGAAADSAAVPVGSGGGGAGLDGGGALAPSFGGWPGPAPLRRLTLRELRNSLADLFGESFPSSLFDSLAADIKEWPAGFDGGARIATAVEVRELMRLGQRVSAAVTTPERLPGLLPTGCPPAPGSPAEQESCARGLIDQLGLRVFRRPLLEPEQEDLLTLYRRRRAEPGADFSSAVRVLVEGMLQSPYFLYRWELGPPAITVKANGPTLVRFNPYELASRLSYAFWASTPDPQLLAAAAADQLVTSEQITTQARRLLASPRAREVIEDFHLQWLELRGLPDQVKDPSFTDYSPEVARAMLRETTAFVSDLYLAPGSAGKLETLLTSSRSFLEPSLARIYGVPAPAVAGPVELPASERAGVFTQGSFLAATASADIGNLANRGNLLLHRLLCRPVLPPENVDVPELVERKPGQTVRQYYEAAVLAQRCAAGCHDLYRLGFAFESYDAIGRHRTLADGLPIDPSGKLELPSGPLEWKDTVDLMRQLAGRPEVAACMTRQWQRYLLRRIEGPGDLSALAAVQAVFRDSGNDLRELMVALTRTAAFTHRAPSEGEELP